MKDFCRILAKINLIFGTIGSFIVAWVMGKDTFYTGYGYIEEQNAVATVAYFIACIFCVAVLDAILDGIATILENQEQIFVVLDKLQSNDKSMSKEIISQAMAPKTEGIQNIVPEQKREKPIDGFDHHTE